jgi:hypothetical protein
MGDEVRQNLGDDGGMTWTAQLTYTVAALTPDDTAALSRELGRADVAYDARNGHLQINLAVEPPVYVPRGQ